MKHVVYVRATNIYDDSRATKEILALAKHGYRITVLAWGRDPSAPELCNKVFAEFSDVVQCHFFNQPMANGIGLKNIGKLFRWFRWVSARLRSLETPHAVHVCNLDAGIGAIHYCKKKHVPLIYDIYDYYVDSHAIPRAVSRFVEKAEISIIDFSTITIICTEERRQQIIKAHPQKLIVLHNSPDVEAESTDILYDYVYCGSFGPQRLIGEFLDEYDHHTDLSVAFAGYGRYADQVVACSNRYPNFSFLGQLPYSAVLDVERHSKVLSAIYEPTIRNHRLCAPNKFYESLALSKPVIVCRGTGIDRIVEQYDLGIVIDYNASQFFAAIQELISDPERCEAIGKRSRSLYEQEYSWKIMEGRLIAAYDELPL